MLTFKKMTMYVAKTVFIPALLTIGFSMSATAAELPVLNLTVKDGHFTPTTLEVKAGEKFKLIVKNEGKTAEEFESKSLKREKVIAPGKQAVIPLGPLKAGTYKFVGEFHEKTAQGQIIAK